MRTSGAWQDVIATEHLEAVYDVSAIIGSERDLPYVIPLRRDVS